MERTEFKVSKFWKSSYTVLFVAMYGYFLIQLMQGKATILSTIFSIAFVSVLPLWLSPYIYQPRLVFDEKGVTIRDLQLLRVFRFDWQDIKGARIKSRLDKVVVLELHSPQQYKKRLSALTRFNLATREIVWGCSFGISTYELGVKAEEIHTLVLEGINKYGSSNS